MARFCQALASPGARLTLAWLRGFERELRCFHAQHGERIFWERALHPQIDLGVGEAVAGESRNELMAAIFSRRRFYHHCGESDGARHMSSPVRHVAIIVSNYEGQDREREETSTGRVRDAREEY
jgi:hypothetical protein